MIEEVHKPKLHVWFDYNKHHKIISIGNSMGITITEPLKAIGIKRGDFVSVKIEGKKIIITKLKVDEDNG